jgi:DmsE family decaheme c-type cytochrome|nr:GSU2203 family decaheme c-type cytochrome [Candidatus Krumholzibacteria bacterium]
MKPRKLSQAAAGMLLLVGTLCLTALPTGALGQTPDDFVGTETCLECHDDLAESHARSLHGRLQDYQYPGLAEGCESCHGSGAKHVASEDPADILHLSAEAGLDGVASCLGCHKTGHTLNWETSTHAQSDVGCLSCHDIHGNGNPALLASADQQDLCFTCHLEAKAQFHLPSHHPLKEGFLTCSSCHDVHSGEFSGVAGLETERDACLSCHTQHAGPFIFEHSPVEEDCGICHSPHGTVANNLLHQNEPFLCLQCHQPHFHSILAGFEGDYETPPGVIGTDPSYEGLSGTSHYDSMKRVMLTKCTQCHQSVHGTDLPSQSIPGQGRALNR